MVLGEIIKEYRIKNKVTLKDFAKRSGLSLAYISMLEKNEDSRTKKPIKPSMETINLVAETVGIPLTKVMYMLGGKKLETSEESIIIGGKIRIAREQNEISQTQLANIAGITKAQVIGYESGIELPDMLTLKKIIKTLHMDANDLFGIHKDIILPSDHKFLANYQKLDSHGQQTMQMLLTRLVDHTEKSKKYPYYPKKTVIYDNEPREILISFYDLNEETDNSDLIVEVDGHSMEDVLYSGDKIFVRRGPIKKLDMGLFVSKGKFLIRYLDSKRLVASNPEYPDIKFDPSLIQCIGKIVGIIKDEASRKRRQNELLKIQLESITRRNHEYEKESEGCGVPIAAYGGIENNDPELVSDLLRIANTINEKDLTELINAEDNDSNRSKTH